jgi:hypothetical protein
VRAFAWLAAGSVLLFAISSHLAFINLRLVGLILLARGAADLWTYLGRERRARCMSRLAGAVAHGADAFESFTADLARNDAARVPLAELLGHRGRRGNG